MTTNSRRQFLLGAAAAATAAVAGPGLRSMAAAEPSQGTLFGSNVYVWTQYAQREKKPFNVGEVISALAELGYDYLESFMDVGKPDNNGKLAEQFKAKGLKPVSLYTGARVHEAATASKTVTSILGAAKVASQAGFSVLSCNAAPIGREKTDAELKTQLAALIELGQGLNEMGMRLAMHHHMPEMANHAREFHYNFRNSKPEVVGFCYDIHWVWKGGLAPAEVLQEYGNRVATWHIRQSRDRVWLEDLESGDVDYDLVARMAREMKLPRRFSVELALEAGTKITRSGVENHRRSLEFVRKVFGA